MTMERNESSRAENHLQGQVAKELDFYRIRDTIAYLASSEEGKDRLLKREPTADREKIEKLKTLGREWAAYQHAAHSPAIISWPPVKLSFKLLGIDGAELSQEQTFALGLFCIASLRAKENILNASQELPLKRLSELAAAMPDLSGAEREIFAILDKDGNVRDLPALRAIRNKIAALKKASDGAIRKYTSDSAMNTVLQSNVPVYRADRQLLAVKADRRGAVSGIIHEVSPSGQTLYIEPDEAVMANNALIQEEAHLQNEIKKILRELTAKISIYKEDFLQSHETMLLLDTTFAAARYQNSIRGVFAESCDRSQEPPAIRGARHPLLGDRAVPVDISFMDGKDILIITGPNTGGKTVTLKTVALFALMNQAGFPIPAEEGTRLPIFSSVFADIGDEQSIDESLSTFSSHMKKMAEIVRYADSDSLILLDELGSGTDPQEGGAIAMAVLDTLIQRNSFVLVTTHHGILKNYGYTNPNCVNASVEFDSSTLRPTYHLLMGVPGESHALDIALRSGLDKSIVDSARDYISSEKADVSALIKGLTAKHEEIDAMLREERIKNAELQQKFVKLHQRELSAKAKELELRERERRGEDKFLVETRSKLENLVRVIREGEITKEKTHAVRDFIGSLTKEMDEREKELEAEKANLEKQKELAQKEEEQLAENGMRLSKSKGHKQSSKKKGKARLSNAEAFAAATVPDFSAQAPKKESKQKAPVKKLVLEPGLQVLVGSKRLKGELLSDNKNGTWSVQFGSLKMNVPRAQIYPVAVENAIKTTPTVEIDAPSVTGTDNEKPQFELRLLGLRYEEAMKALEHQIDLCIIHNFKSFSIIHGKGSGILQQAVHDYLSHYPGVKDFRFASPEEGGTGKTYVTLM